MKSCPRCSLGQMFAISLNGPLNRGRGMEYLCMCCGEEITVWERQPHSDVDDRRTAASFGKLTMSGPSRRGRPKREVG